MSTAVITGCNYGIGFEFAPHSSFATVLNPGSVKMETRNGGQIPVTERVSGMRHVIKELTPETTGTFQRYDGGTIEWQGRATAYKIRGVDQ